LLSATAQRSAAGEAVDRATRWLLSAQHPAGYWKDEFVSNVTTEAEDLFVREFLGVRTAEQTAGTAEWIRSHQRPDGSWALFHGGPADLNCTVEAYVALRLAGDPATDAHMRAAAQVVDGLGGLARTRYNTRFWLALLGLWPWDELPPMLPELVLLPRWMPFNLYDFAYWTRLMCPPIALTASLRPSCTVPFELSELRRQPAPRPSLRARLLVGALRAYERWQPRTIRRLAHEATAAWIVRRQEADGTWGGMQPPWIYSLLALRVLGYPLDHPVMRVGLAGLDGYTIHDERGRRIEASQGPIWDTALAVLALREAGLAADHAALAQAGQFLLDHEVRARGDWAVTRPGLEPGGWSFEFVNTNYPDIDDSLMAVLALREIELPDRERRDRAIDRGVRWVAGMQCRDGGWAAFDADNTRQLARFLPHADYGELHDPPCPDITAHAVEMLAAVGRGDDPAARRGVAWLLRHQEADGAWYGRWGVNYVFGTAAAVCALRAAGLPATHHAVARGVRWLLDHQRPDGAWGEDPRSYTDPSWRGRGDPTPSQTGWALAALLAAGGCQEEADRGVAWLVQAQLPDGSWDQPQFTGTGFPGDYLINYSLYRVVFPLMALGRYVQKESPRA
jgi:squalene-hopene/tetraprenyl-beta-curcumene cyclase